MQVDRLFLLPLYIILDTTLCRNSPRLLHMLVLFCFLSGSGGVFCNLLISKTHILRLVFISVVLVLQFMLHEHECTCMCMHAYFVFM